MTVNEHYDRLRVVIETLAYAQPDMPMKDAVAAIFEIEDRVLARPAAGTLHVPSMPVTFEKGDMAAWINAHGAKHTDSFGQSIIDLMHAGKKINAIKEVRVATGAGLKEAKDAVEEYERLYGSAVR